MKSEAHLNPYHIGSQSLLKSAQAMPTDSHAFLGWTKPTGSEKAFCILRGSSETTIKKFCYDQTAHYLTYPTDQRLGSYLEPPHEQIYTPAQQQEQAVLSAKNAIDALTQSLLTKQNLPLSPYKQAKRTEEGGEPCGVGP